jgi:hypothetical protein
VGLMAVDWIRESELVSLPHIGFSPDSRVTESNQLSIKKERRRL